MTNAFRDEMAAGYGFDEPSLVLGSPVRDDAVLDDVRVQLPLSRVNRHGLIAGATGTGKTKTLQILAGELSKVGVPVFAVDVKGDLSGVGAAAIRPTPRSPTGRRTLPGRSSRPRTPSRCCRSAARAARRSGRASAASARCSWARSSI